jgi:hypothetical protein
MRGRSLVGWRISRRPRARLAAQACCADNVHLIVDLSNAVEIFEPGLEQLLEIERRHAAA